MTREVGGLSIPQTIVFTDRLSDHCDLETASEETRSVSPLRSEHCSVAIDKSTHYEEDTLIKTIREQIQKQPIKSDPPAWSKHLRCNPGCSVEKKKKHQDKRDDGSKQSIRTSKELDMVATEPNMLVKFQMHAAFLATASSQPQEEQVGAIAEKARAEIADLEAQLARQEQEAVRLAEQAAAIVAQLEVEADKKAKMAEVAILKAKLALQVVDTCLKNNSDVAETIALPLSETEKISNITEDRAEISSSPSTKDERQEHFMDDNNEVSAITDEVVDIVEPPKIIRQTEFPIDVKTKEKELSVVTDMDDGAHEWVVSPLNDDSPRKRSMDDSTRETIYKKIEECQGMILDPNASIEEQFKAAELLEKMARIAKIAEELEPRKFDITPSGCSEAVTEGDRNETK
jgi:hypothetical protein